MDSPPRKTSPLKGEKDVEGGLFESSSEDGYSESSEEGSPIFKGHREGDNFSPETATAVRSKFMLHPTKRLRNHNVEELRKFSPTSPSPTGTSYNIVTLSAPCPRGKLSSVNKSKRRRLESRFEEQQEELKLIHDKFKQDIYQHLQECKTTLEGLELHQIDFNGTVKKRKASHQKLLMQAEEAVKTQLDDAQRRITAVQKASCDFVPSVGRCPGREKGAYQIGNKEAREPPRVCT
ncbi:hypothetical protein Peur_011416 [Populus x canadensis]